MEKYNINKDTPEAKIPVSVRNISESPTAMLFMLSMILYTKENTDSNTIKRFFRDILYRGCDKSKYLPHKILCYCLNTCDDFKCQDTCKHTTHTDDRVLDYIDFFMHRDIVFILREFFSQERCLDFFNITLDKKGLPARIYGPETALHALIFISSLSVKYGRKTFGLSITGDIVSCKANVTNNYDKSFIELNLKSSSAEIVRDKLIFFLQRSYKASKFGLNVKNTFSNAEGSYPPSKFTRGTVDQHLIDAKSVPVCNSVNWFVYNPFITMDVDDVKEPEDSEQSSFTSTSSSVSSLSP